MGRQLGREYWDSLYEGNEIGWDIGHASPALSNYVDQVPSKDISILIPGCGNGYEASYLLDKGFNDITLIDISPRLTSALKQKFADRLGNGLKIVTGDFFEMAGKFDLVLEQTFLSALPPSLRIAYCDKIIGLLKPGGKLAGVVFNRIFDEDGPPFGALREDYESLFKDKFLIKTMELCYNSIDRRAGTELFIILERKA